MAERGYEALVGRSLLDIEKDAGRFRSNLGISDTAPIPGVSLFEQLDGEEIAVSRQQYPVSIAVKPLSSAVLALALFDPTRQRFVLTLSEATYNQLEEDEPRARFTVAHEIGHLVLHRDELVQLSSIPHNSLQRSGTHRIYRDTEWQANSFAAALLMPASGLKKLEEKYGGLDQYDIQNAYNVSAQAASYRLAKYQEKLRARS